ncbi:hypothetical protein [Paracoccus suum]|uniref:hypothetical protein n=1 Tax=Paracoccus suum TaxID=2259340 RepID=UPI0013B050C1|nr:hypothetical protein [Paracoccus suum]
MALHVEHEIHRRRASRNLGLLAVLVLFAGLIFGLTIAKVENGDNMKAWDHQMDRQLEPGAGTPIANPAATATPAAPAQTTPASAP